MNELMQRICQRERSMFLKDLNDLDPGLLARFIITGAGGTIGTTLVLEIFRLYPTCVVVAIDMDETRLSHLCRIVRSKFDGAQLITLTLDINDMPLIEGDYLIHLAAMKHVRTEGDVHSLARMVENNVQGIAALMDSVRVKRAVFMSSDKAADPNSTMGMTKAIGERMFSVWDTPSNAVRMGNIACSNGSLLDWAMKTEDDTICAPRGIRRWFLAPEEAAHLLLVAALRLETGDILIPKLNPNQQRLVSDAVMDLRRLKTVVLVDPDPADKETEVMYGKDETVTWNAYHGIGLIPMPVTSQLRSMR